MYTCILIASPKCIRIYVDNHGQVFFVFWGTTVSIGRVFFHASITLSPIIMKMEHETKLLILEIHLFPLNRDYGRKGRFPNSFPIVALSGTSTHYVLRTMPLLPSKLMVRLSPGVGTAMRFVASFEARFRDCKHLICTSRFSGK